MGRISNNAPRWREGTERKDPARDSIGSVRITVSARVGSRARTSGTSQQWSVEGRISADDRD
jgi:hypothetical protein